MLYIEVDSHTVDSVGQAVTEMIDLAKKTGCFVKTKYDGVKVWVHANSDKEKVIKEYHDSRIRMVEENKNALDKLTLDEVLTKMGGLKWPCHSPRLTQKGYYRMIEYKVNRGIFKGNRTASIRLTNLFPEYALRGMN